MDTLIQQQSVQLPVYNWLSVAHGAVHCNWCPEPVRYLAPLQPRYMGSLYASSCVVGVHHQWHNHFFRLHTGDIVCRSGPCATCSTNFYDTRIGFPRRQQYFQAVAGAEAQVINYTPPQSSPIRQGSIIVQPKLKSINPSLAPTSAYVKRESSSEEDTTLIDQPTVQSTTDLASLGRNAIGGPTPVSWPTRLIRDEKMLRIQTWRTQVQPMPSDALQPDVGDMKDWGIQKLSKKRKAGEDTSVCDYVKRIKVESDGSVNTHGDSRTDGSAPRLARNSTPCENCRVARKKCSGKRGMCAFASPKTRAKAQWKQKHISVKDET